MCNPSPNEIYFHTHTATSISNDVPKFLENNLLRLRNQTVNKITQNLDYTAQLLSTQKVITVPTFKVDVESVLSHRHTSAVAPATDWQLYQWCRDQCGAITQLFVLSNGRHGPTAIDSLVQYTPDHVNSFIILFVPYPFSTLSTLIKSLSSSDKILFINTGWHHARRKCCASAG